MVGGEVAASEKRTAKAQESRRELSKIKFSEEIIVLGWFDFSRLVFQNERIRFGSEHFGASLEISLA